MAMANFEYELEIPSRLRKDKEAIPGTRRWCDEHKRGAWRDWLTDIKLAGLCWLSLPVLHKFKVDAQ